MFLHNECWHKNVSQCTAVEIILVVIVYILSYTPPHPPPEIWVPTGTSLQGTDRDHLLNL